MAKLNTIQTIITIFTMENMHMVQFDIKTMFLYGDIFEELYMDQVEGFEDSVFHIKGTSFENTFMD